MSRSAEHIGHFRPCLTLQTLTRGDGLLGMRPSGSFGPRGGMVTVAHIDWRYTTDSGLQWQTPAPTRLLNRRPDATEVLLDATGRSVTLLRDLGAEADALDLVWESGLQPIPELGLQWRSDPRSDPLSDQRSEFSACWTLLQEDFFADFWAEQLPLFQAG